MNFFDAIYTIIIGPLELIFELIYYLSNKMLSNLGLSIIVLSLVMNLLVLPLYKRADAMQEEQRATENKLKKWVTHIKKTFKGDERFMMLQTYYRQNNYKPTSILKGSVSLLLEIPFFIAAYNFLSHADVFNGVHFGPFTDLSRPDGLIKIGVLSINLLPILMTAINIISSMIYTKGLPKSSKVQLYGMAAIFLILLYDSPSCLVFYWTLNNLFSLIKNIFYKLKNPKKILSLISSITGILILIFGLFIYPMNTTKKIIFLVALFILLEVPLVYRVLRSKLHLENKNKPKHLILDKKIFYFSILFLSIFIGIFIPSQLLKSSPLEFLNTFTGKNPLYYILNSFLLAFGLFTIWGLIFYSIASPKGKNIITFTVIFFVVCSIIDYMIFGETFNSNLSSLLIYDDKPSYSKFKFFINLLLIFLFFVIVFFVLIKNQAIVKHIIGIIIPCILIISTINFLNINNTLKFHSDNVVYQQSKVPEISLSKNKKNVMVIMMDRAIGSYIPYLFNEKPDLVEKFAGFTFYPNTVSFGAFTNTGSPSLYGGYEYIPEEINKRSNESLESKQNEALKVMPVIFDNNGYSVTVCDPTYAGYKIVPDLSIFSEYPSIKTYITMGNKFLGFSDDEFQIIKEKLLNRNIFIYSLMKSVPLIFQETIYSEGEYCNTNKPDVYKSDNMHTGTGINHNFLTPYFVLKKLPNITSFNNEEATFLMISNDTTHEPCILKEPEYEPSEFVDNTLFDENNKDRFVLEGHKMNIENSNQLFHYQANMAAMIQLGNYFDFLRENNVYDNTRIIIVADHGRNLHQFDNMIFGDGEGEDAQFFNPLFMVKDFYEREFKIDSSFMTNADTSIKAFEGLIDSPTNPFTGNLINDSVKHNGKLNIFLSFDWSTENNNGNTFIPGNWYTVHDNIFDKNNWEFVGKH